MPLVRPIGFVGSCQACFATVDKARGGIELGVQSDGRDPTSVGHAICLKCAAAIAKRLTAAIAICKHKMADGLEYHHDKWQAKKTP